MDPSSEPQATNLSLKQNDASLISVLMLQCPTKRLEKFNTFKSNN